MLENPSIDDGTHNHAAFVAEVVGKIVSSEAMGRSVERSHEGRVGRMGEATCSDHRVEKAVLARCFVWEPDCAQTSHSCGIE